MRSDYAKDPTLLSRVFELYEHAWPGMTARAEGARGWGGVRWEVSTPFLRCEGARVLSHVGVLEMNLVVGGRPMLVGGVHAVVTHPDHRKRGLSRALMEEALAWCDERYGTLLLTGEPALYDRYGFRSVPEHRFAGNHRGSGGSGLRLLDRKSVADGELLLRLLDARAPVSRRLGIVRDRAIFLFDTALWPLHHAKELDAVVAYSVKDGKLRLFDVVAERMPSLDRVIALVPEPFERVEVYFAPDLVGGDGLAPEPHPLGLDDYLMIRGPWPVEREFAMLPVPARC
jgi:GNAT superfamily N-acetyltransferase